MEEISGHIYDFPQYYDLIYGSDWKAEFDFLLDCFQQHATRTVKNLFEPACGTGRLLYRLAKAGYSVSGVDLNQSAVSYCNSRLKRQGFKNRVLHGDMANFQVKQTYDAAFNMVSSFRHLNSEKAASNHFKCIEKSLNRGGIYILGTHLTPSQGGLHADEESWASRRGHLSVLSRLWSESVDLKKREEIVGMMFDIYTPTKQFRIADECKFRTYTAAQFTNLIKKTPKLEIAATYDFSYDIESPIEVGPETHDVVYILRRR